MHVPLFVPWINKSDKKMIVKALNSSQLTDGPTLQKFERDFSHLTKCKFAMGVSNGTSALHLALTSLEIGEGDEVIIPNLTFIATANAVLHVNAIPVLADVDSSLCISTTSIKNKISKKTKAIIPVHFAGYPCKIDEIKKLAGNYNLQIIEDCAHAIGTYHNGKHVGLFGNVGCFSFYPTKNITTIEGGMIITNSRNIASKITKLRNHGLTKTLAERYNGSKPWLYDMKKFGYNYRLDEIRSALGMSQLKRFKEITEKRVKAAEYYDKKLQNITGIEIPKSYTKDNQNHVYHLYIIKIKNKFGISRNKLIEKLNKKGIKTTVHYKPIHRFTYFKRFNLSDKEFPSTMKAYKECLTLPLFPTISRKQQDYVISNLTSFKK